MYIESVFLVIAGILFLGFIGEYIFEKTKIPDVIWLLLLGIFLGSVLKWVSPESLASVAPFFTTFALIFLLFEAGINMDIRAFLKSAPRGLKLSIASFILSFGVIFAIGLLLGKGIILSFLMGTILAGISSAVVLPFLKGMNVQKETELSMIFDSAFSDVLCILGTVAILDVYTTKVVAGLSIISQVFSSFLIAIALGLIAALVWNNVLQKRIKNHRLILTLAFMLVVYSITQLMGANGAIAALVFGLILGNTKKLIKLVSFKKVDTKKSTNKTKSVETETYLKVITASSKNFYSQLAFFIKAFFFVYLGILMNFSEGFSFLWAFLILIGLYLVRPFAVFLAFGKKTPLADVKILETLIPKGLAAAVLVQLPIQAGVPGAESLVGITLAMILLSIVVSSFFVYLIQKNKYTGIFPFLYKHYLPVTVKKSKK